MTEPGDAEPPVVLTDPAAVRALAHPARLAVIDALYAGETLTATECAELAGISPSAMSYHLRALERFGLAVRAPGRGDGRQRPWRRAGSALRVDLTDTSHGQGATAATELLIETTMAADRQRLIAEISAAPDDEPDQWRRAATYERLQIVATIEEARSLRESIEALLEAFETENRDDPPPEAERMVVSLLIARENPA